MPTFEEIWAEGVERRRAARRIDPLAVDCPYCYALPNVPCSPCPGIHVKRHEAAQAASLFLWRIEQATFKPTVLEAQQAS